MNMQTEDEKIEPVLATALVSYTASNSRELSHEVGDLIEIKRDLGDGVVFGYNLSQSGLSGILSLRHIQLNKQTSILEMEQLAMEDIMSLKRELESVRSQRESMQEEVKELRDTRDELLKSVNPVRFGLRDNTDVIMLLIQTDMELVLFNDTIREFQSNWGNTLQDINKLGVAMDDMELEPFRSLVADRMEALKKKVIAMQGPTQELINCCKYLHIDLENMHNALRGLPLLPRSPALDSVTQTSSQASLGSFKMSTSSFSINTNPATVSNPSTSTSPSSSKFTSASLAYAGATTISPNDSLRFASITPPEKTQPFFVPSAADVELLASPAQSPPSSSIPSESSSSPPFGPAVVSPVGPSEPQIDPSPPREIDFGSLQPRFIERTGLLGGQRLRGSSPAAYKPETSSISSPTLPRAPGSFVFATKPGSRTNSSSSIGQ